MENNFSRAQQTKDNLEPGIRRVPAKQIPTPTADVSDKAQTAIGAAYNSMMDWDLDPGSPQGWKDAIANTAAQSEPLILGMLQALEVTMEQREIGGVNCYVLTPKSIPAAHRNQQVVVAHGGGYVFTPGPAGVGEAAIVAALGGYRTIAVDYRMAPDAPFPAAVDDMVAVWRSLAAENDPRCLAMTGTSAGGGLILAALLKIKAMGLPMPGAIAPSSPWADLTETGDSYQTNEWIDNVLVSYSGFLGRAARLYAAGHDLHDPLLSPINGDFSGFPPALFIAGTRDIFLSNAVRAHRKMRRAGIDSQLHVFEGISHAQLSFDPSMPETVEAYGEIRTFFDQYLAT
ncbi:MAG: alpha/beta hydrolase [Pseudomonadota bacterium]